MTINLPESIFHKGISLKDARINCGLSVDKVLESTAMRSMVSQEDYPELLEQAIEERTNIIFDTLCENDQGELYKRFVQSIRLLNSDMMIELENIFILWTRQAVYVSYKAGVSAAKL